METYKLFGVLRVVRAQRRGSEGERLRGKLCSWFLGWASANKLVDIRPSVIGDVAIVGVERPFEDVVGGSSKKNLKTGKS